ncbi:MAG TPA: endolytic transglycosylase MltG [Bryobacteraceae bacterium]|nr:endolytic transglycosylase MltG [Bryobacteraceae bacterium]
MTKRRFFRSRTLLRLFAAVFLLAAAGLGFVFLSLRWAYQGFENEVIVDFPKGTSSTAIAAELARSGVVRFSWQFLVVRALSPGRFLQAGEYQFTHADTPWHVFDRIARGDVFYYELTVPEGSNIFDIAASLGRFDFLQPTDFLKAARDPSLIRDLAPNAPTLEGYLFPSTYRITRRTTVEQLCQMMTGLFRRHWRELESPGDPASVNATVALASLVEKETAVAAERPVVASVYENRLKRGMALDCDPTTIYAALLDQRYRGTIYRSDLNSTNAYNTYQHAGLPPGPIANPGMDALRAALHPAETGYLYFVANPDGSGTHHFSKTIEEHNRAVQQYRRARQPITVDEPAPRAHGRHHRHRKGRSLPKRQDAHP